MKPRASTVPPPERCHNDWTKGNAQSAHLSPTIAALLGHATAKPPVAEDHPSPDDLAPDDTTDDATDDATDTRPELRQRRLDWAALLRRTFRKDVLECPRCHGRLKVIAAISEPSVVRKILRHLGLPTAGPKLAPARAPPDLDLDFT